MTINEALKKLAENGLMFGFLESGEMITVPELLTKKLGRQVEFDEAVAYIRKAKKDKFIRTIKEKKLKNENLCSF